MLTVVVNSLVVDVDIFGVEFGMALKLHSLVYGLLSIDPRLLVWLLLLM